MSDEKKIKIELPDALEEPAKALAMPLATNAGTTIGDLWFLAMGGISQAAAKRRAKYALELDKYKKDMEKKLNDIPAENRIEPNTQVVLNALADSQSCVEEESLREMFANLIASACDAGKASDVHPAFPGIIRQMSPIDAKLLQLFRNDSERPIVGIKVYEGDGYLQMFNNIFVSDTSEFSAAVQSATVACLSMLGLVEVSYMQSFTDKSVYNEFLQMPEYLFLKDKKVLVGNQGRVVNISKVELQHGEIWLTELGKRFLKVCT